MSVVEQAPDLGSDGLKRDVGLLGLMWASEGSLIGSGWLFAAFVALTLAGPSALLGWVIASIIVILLALVHAELGGMFPVSGGTSRYPHYAYGSLAGGTFGWFAYIQAATVAPVEVLATIQYFSTVSWASHWYKPPLPGQLNGTLSGGGIIAAIVLMLVFTYINLVGIRWLANLNTGLTTWKVIIPVLTMVVLLLTHFHVHNFTAGGGFFIPGGFNIGAKAILVAIPGGGIVFSLLGFEQAVQLGGESANPQRDLPRAVIGSIIIGAAIYILLQFVFIASLNPATIAHFHTWANLATSHALSGGPYYTVAKVAGLAWLAWILRVDAVVSPAGTGLIYLTASTRLSFGLRKDEPADEGPSVGRHHRGHHRPRLPAAVSQLVLIDLPSDGGLGDDVRRCAARTRRPTQEQAGTGAVLPPSCGGRSRTAVIRSGQLHCLLVGLEHDLSIDGRAPHRLRPHDSLQRTASERACAQDRLGRRRVDRPLHDRHDGDLLLRELRRWWVIRRRRHLQELLDRRPG